MTVAGVIVSLVWLLYYVGIRSPSRFEGGLWNPAMTLLQYIAHTTSSTHTDSERGREDSFGIRLVVFLLAGTYGLLHLHQQQTL